MILRCFSESTCDVYGSKLREQVEDRLKFYESGDIPRKNVEVMQEAILEANAVLVIWVFPFYPSMCSQMHTIIVWFLQAAMKKDKKKKKKKENGLEVSVVESENGTNGNGTEAEADKTMEEDAPGVNGADKKKKKKKKKEAGLETSVAEPESSAPAEVEAEKPVEESTPASDEAEKKKKKKKKKNAGGILFLSYQILFWMLMLFTDNQGNDESVVETAAEPAPEVVAEPVEVSKKSKKKRELADSTLDQSAVEESEATPAKKSKKKKKNVD